MYCGQCGREISGGARYCPNCGLRQEQKPAAVEVSPGKQDQRKKWRKDHKLWNLLASVVALAILIAAEKEAPDAGDYTFRQMVPAYFAVENQGETAICNEEGEFCLVDTPRQFLYSGDRGQLAYIDRDGELYYMMEMKPVFIDDHVSAAELSFYGETIAYLRDGDENGKELCIYNIRTEKSRRLSVKSGVDFILSPDGRTAAYVEAEEAGALYVWRAGGREVKAGENVSELFSVSNNGKTVLCRKTDDQLFLYFGDQERKVAGVSGGVSYLLNENQTEMLYTEGGSSWYYSVDWKEPVRLTGVKGDMLIPCYPQYAMHQRKNGWILGRETLKNMIFATCDPQSCGFRLYQLDKKGASAASILHRAEQFQVAEDGRSILWLSEGRLYYIEDVGDSQSRECLSDSMEVRQFAADWALKKIWFVTAGQELYYSKGGASIWLADGLEQLQMGCTAYINRLDGVLFQKDASLYLAKGAEAEPVRENVEEVRVCAGRYVVVNTDHEFRYLKELKEEICLMGSRQF